MTKIIKPQPGFQTNFLRTPADFALGGGSAGAGKSFALLLEFPRYSHVKNWTGVIFRRTLKQVTDQGGLWDSAESLYLPMVAGDLKNPTQIKIKTNLSAHTFQWDSGATLQFAHLQYENDKINWQGAQIGYLGFDELTHFTQSQFLYMLTRNRSATGIQPYCRATTNPQGEGWVKELVSWFIYPDDYPVEHLRGAPIPERAGVLRYFTRYKGQYVWGNTRTEVLEALPADVASGYTKADIKSFTFIPGTLAENEILTKLDPSYKGNLLAQDEYLVEQLLKGRWIAQSDDQSRIVRRDALRDIFTNDFVPHGPKYLTADIALEGNDKFVLVAWSGWRVLEIRVVDKIMGDGVVNEMRQMARQYSIPNSHIAFDSDGVGNYLKGYFRGARAVHGGAQAIRSDDNKTTYGNKPAYFNLRAQLYYTLAEKINSYGIYVDSKNEIQISEIMEEIWAHKKVIILGQPYKISPKDEVKLIIGRSPDYSDAFAQRAIFDLDGIAPARRSSSAM